MSEADKIEMLKESAAIDTGRSVKRSVKEVIKGMSEEELQIAAKNIPSSILWDELRKRYEVKSDVVRQVRMAAKIVVDDVDERE